MNLNLALPRQVATSHGLRWDLEMEFWPLCAVLFLGVEHLERQRKTAEKGWGCGLKSQDQGHKRSRYPAAKCPEVG